MFFSRTAMFLATSICLSFIDIQQCILCSIQRRQNKPMDKHKSVCLDTCTSNFNCDALNSRTVYSAMESPEPIVNGWSCPLAQRICCKTARTRNDFWSTAWKALMQLGGINSDIKIGNWKSMTRWLVSQRPRQKLSYLADCFQNWCLTILRAATQRQCEETMTRNRTNRCTNKLIGRPTS